MRRVQNISPRKSLIRPAVGLQVDDGSIQPYCPTQLLHCFEKVGLGRVATAPFPTRANALPNSASTSDREWIHSDSWAEKVHEQGVECFQGL